MIDCGCTKTVCGTPWLNSYLETLSRSDQLLIEYHPDNTKFRFGDGPLFTSKKLAIIPVQLGSQKFKLISSVVECDVPLLLSRVSLKRADATIDFKSDELWIAGDKIEVKESKSGHLCVPLITRNVKQTVKQVMFSCPLQKDDDDKANITKIEKLHKQFAHPTAEKLKELIRNSGVVDKKIFKIVDAVTDKCDTCKRFKRPPLRPVVSMPLASEFNEVVALDIKFIDQVPILHMIDHATRYSMSCRIRNKRAETIVEAVMNHWIRIFGSPSQYFLSDNGGEFVNSEVRELCAKFNLKLETTGAEASWSNGLVERHHAMIEDNVRKVMNDSNCNLDIAVPWANSAKNALGNVYGFSANQLVFGRNINLPSVHHDRLPARNESSCSNIISRHLLALHRTRQAFITQESCERLRRALNRQTRSFSDVVYQIGDQVYFKRNESKEWYGPAKVLGCEKSQYLLKHGGNYVRVHPCRMQLVNITDTHGLPGRMLINESNVSKNQNHSGDRSVNDGNTIVNNVSDDNASQENNTVTTPETPATQSQHIAKTLETPVTKAQHAAKNTFDKLQQGSSLQPELNENNEPHCQNEEVDQSRKVKIPRALARLKDYNSPGLLETNTPALCQSRTQKNDPENKELAENQSECDQENDHDKEEVYYGTSTDSARYDRAKIEELDKWKEFNAYEEVPDTGQPRITSKWVCTEKMKGGHMITKARLVARGFEEDKSQIRTDSPTCYKDSLRMLLTVLSAKKWRMKSIDIRRAYLQGNRIQREVFLKPPKEANTTNLWKLLQTPDGIVDAGRQWYIRVQKEFLALGAKQVKCDRAVFVWEDPNQSGPCGLMLAHVDDFLYGGNDYFLNTIIPKIRNVFKVGLEEEDKLKYLGLGITQTSNGIDLSLENYIQGMKEMDTSKLGQDKSRKLNNLEKTEMKQLIGQINWIATQNRPDIAYENCVMGGVADKSSVSDVFQVNKIVRKVQGQQLNLFFPSNFLLDSVRIVTFCDAAFANLPDYGSQGGFMCFLVDDQGTYNLISWQSKRIKRVVNSSLSAECLAAVEAAETSVLIRHKLEEMLCLERGSIPISILSDSKSLVEAVHKSTSVQNKSLQIDINMLREMIEEGTVNEFRWVATNDQIANSLTKRGASTDNLKNVLMNKGMFDINTGIFRH